ncbi:hypothetical protein [Parapedobacter indicus]|uniref:Uncharacterized protein n=1 Tax=Parapedobacter indicus TaxID=1477437 RepID=A0A1I3V3M8_9SPHI|nr:hypothetical protein [Parapedobacter indicus]PPK98983.1 hypothetical protein CLV26_11512 [Parapedobacter indicus]SFJ89589.1 hypothetical protein SAMN05444682_115165 [Parapedobacter indicus]
MNISLNIFDRFIAAITKKSNTKSAPQMKVVSVGNPHKLGDIFVESWGYEQTNVDAYQVVKVNKASVILREICLETVESTGWASDNVKPVKDSFVSDETYIKIVSQKNGDYLKGIKHGCLIKYKGGSLHRSWYA